jgi:hypothetical protein
MNGASRRTFVSFAALLSIARAMPQAHAAAKARRIGVLAVGSPTCFAEGMTLAKDPTSIRQERG